MSEAEKYSKMIKAEALRLGFSACGISKVQELTEESKKLQNWLSKGNNAGMTYMNNHFDKRINPKELVPNSKSVISVILNYFPGDIPYKKGKARISKYALGRDYHKVMKKKLKELYLFIDKEIQNIDGRFFSDSAPVMDKAWAEKSGLGWRGKNANIINKDIGSFFFIGELIVDIVLEEDKAINEACGSCTRCIDACPTNAIETAYQINSTLCISYQTIENKNLIPNKIVENIKDNIFGCDICQDVCPWNKKASITKINDFGSRLDLLNLQYNDYLAMSEKEFDTLFNGTPIKRAGYSKIQQTVKQIVSYQKQK